MKALFGRLFQDLLVAASRLRRCSDGIKVTGSVKVYMTDFSGFRTLAYANKNLVVTTGLNTLRDAISGGTTDALRTIEKMAFGTDATAAAAGQTDLVARVGSIDRTVAVDYPTDGAVRFTAGHTSAQGNGFTFRELGLFDTAGTRMFSRLVIPDVAKTSAVSMTIEWTISFS